jgi:O-acetylserine/cysteine efflux transporter
MTPRDMALATLTSVIWGLGFVISQFALESFSAPHLTALRFLIAAIPACFLARPRIPWSMLILIGLTLFTGQFLMLFYAYKMGMPPGLASVTQQMQVFFTVILAAIFLRDIPTRHQTTGMAIALAGLGLIALTTGAGLTMAGFWLAVTGAFSWAIGNVLVKRLGPIPMFSLVVWLSLVPPLPALLIARIQDPTGPSFATEILQSSWSSLAAALYLGAIATVLAYALWSRLLARYPSAMVAPFALLAPCVGVIASALILGERFTLTRTAGMALILAGLVIIIRPSFFLSVARLRNG